MGTAGKGRGRWANLGDFVQGAGRRVALMELRSSTSWDPQNKRAPMGLSNGARTKFLNPKKRLGTHRFPFGIAGTH